MRELAEYYPCRLLINKYNLNTKMKYLMSILPRISILFKIDRKKLLDEYTKEYLYYDFLIEEREKKEKDRRNKFTRFEIMEI